MHLHQCSRDVTFANTSRSIGNESSRIPHHTHKQKESFRIPLLLCRPSSTKSCCLNPVRSPNNHFVQQIQQEHAVSFPPRFHFGLDSKQDSVTDRFIRTSGLSSVVLVSLTFKWSLPISTNSKPRQTPRTMSNQPWRQQWFHIHVHTFIFHQVRARSAHQPFQMVMCVFNHSVALVTALWIVPNNRSSWSSPFLQQFGNLSQALLLVTRDRDLLVTPKIQITSDRGHRKLTRRFDFRSNWLKWFLLHRQNRQHVVTRFSARNAEVHCNRRNVRRWSVITAVWSATC